MPAREIKTKLVLDGEREYAAGLEKGYKTVSQLGRELKLTAARFLENADSMEAHKAKAEVLRREIAAQEDVIKSLSDRIKYADTAYEGNTEAQELYAQKIDRAMRALASMKGELASSESVMAGMSTASEKAATDLGKTESATRDMGAAAAAAKQTVEKLSGGFTVFKGVLSNLTTDALRRGGQMLKDFLSDGVTLASNLAEVDNVVSTAFKGSEADIKAFADSAAQNFGLSSLAAQQYAGKMGAALNAMGLENQAAEMSKTLTGLSGDLASFWNISADEANAKLFSGVVSGETEGLKSLGIVMSDANLQAYAMAQGITKKTSAMTADEKALLRYQFVMNATKQAQGDFAKTSGSLANQMRIATLVTENAESAFGEKLAPSVNKVIGRFNTWMQGDYGKKVIASTAEAAGQLAEGALTALGTALGWVVEHMETIQAGVAAIGIGFLAAKVTGFVMTMGNLVRTLLTASKAAGALNAVMAMNPAVLVGLSVAALTAGVIALAASYKTLDDKLADLKLNVPQTSVDAVTDGINAGIAAADKTHEVTVTVNADTQSLKDQLDGFLSEDSGGGGKITKKEYTAISKYVSDIVDPDLEKAKTQLAAQKEDFKASLLAIVDDSGNSPFTEERAEELATGLGDKTQKLISELEQYKTDYVALAKQIYKDGRTPTEAEIANLQTLLDKIGVVRVELSAAQDSATQVLKARTERVKGGTGTERDFGEALGYTQQLYVNEAADRHAANEAAIAQLQTDIDTWNATLQKGGMTAEETETTVKSLNQAKTDMASIFAADEQVDTTVFAEQQAEIQKLFDGMAKANPDAAGAIAEYAKLYDQYQLFIRSLASGEGFEPEEKKALLTPENLKAYLGLDMTQADIDAMFADPMSFDTQIDSYLMQMRTAMETKIGQADGLTDNPMMAYLQAMLNSGTLENLDMTTLDGSLESALKTMDMIARGTAVGGDLVSGITGGIGDAAGKLTKDDLTTLRDKVIEQTRAVFDSHSPAKTMYPVGEDITAGLTTGMTDDTAKTAMTAAAESIRSTVADAMNLTSAGEDAADAYATGLTNRRATVVSKAKSLSLSAKGGMYQYNSFYTVGQNNIDGFIAGMRSRLEAAKLAIKDIMAAVIQAAKDALGQKSPSKAFQTVGMYSAMGFEVGFAARMDQAEKLVADRLKRTATVPDWPGYGVQRGGARAGGGEGGNLYLTQNVYANETSYAAQQREAARQFTVIARRMRG